MVHILLDDDNETSRLWLRQELAAMGHSCADASHGKPLGYADVLLTVNPAPDSRFSAQPLPVICCFTANPGAEVIAGVIANGAAEVLVMPVSRQILQFKLEQVIRPAPARAA